jgi:DNA-binding NtrC family response regulator
MGGELTEANFRAVLLGEGGEPGVLERAKGGILFIDDLEDMAPGAQQFLLGVLEQGEFARPVAGAKEPLDVRIVSSAPPGFERDEDFKRELLSHLCVIVLRVPPLREYSEDVPELLRYHVDSFVDSEGLPFRRFSVAAQNRLRNYPWPGNVRELKNLAESLLVMSRGKRIDRGDLPDYIERPEGASRDLPVRVGRPRHEIEFDLLLGRLAEIEHRVAYLSDLVLSLRNALGMNPRPSEEEIVHEGARFTEIPQGDEIVVDPGTSIRDVERALIERTLARVRGNRKRAAKMLGIGERTLYRRMKEYGI